MLQTWRLRENSVREEVEEFLSILEEKIGAAILDQARVLCREYADVWGARPEIDLSVHSERAAVALAYHWWRWEGGQTTTRTIKLWSEGDARARLVAAIDRIKAGQLYSEEEAERLGTHPVFQQNRVPDVLEEVAFAEEVCQHPTDPRITGEFHRRYDRYVELFIERQRHPLARQELEGCLHNFWMPRERRGPKLAGFNGKAPIAAWLWVALTRQFMTILRQQGGRLPRLSTIDSPGGEGDFDPCQHYLRPLARLYREMSRDWNERDRSIWELVTIGQVPQYQVATWLRLSKPSISRICKKFERRVTARMEKHPELNGDWHKRCRDHRLEDHEDYRFLFNTMLREEFRWPRL